MAEAHALEICSAALVLLGEEPIASFGEGSAAATVAERLYPIVRDALLGGHPWRFNRRRHRLTRLAAEAPPPWTGLYALPPGTLRLALVTVGGSRCAWDTFADGVAVMADAGDEVAAEVHEVCDEAQFSSAFRRGLTYALAADFAVALTEDRQRAGQFAAMGEQQMRLARHQNATEHPFGLGEQAGQGRRFERLRRR